MRLFDFHQRGGLFAPAKRSDDLSGRAKLAQLIPEGGRPQFSHWPMSSGRRRDPAKREFMLILRIEGGTGPNGEFLTSQRGAVGPAQVMRATAPEAAQLAGLPWDERRYRTDADYNIRLGQAYYREQRRIFRDPVLAAAAYNWGPTALRAAIRESKRTGTKVEFLMPPETQKYVARFRRYLENR